jgi:hypothetical protein
MLDFLFWRAVLPVDTPSVGVSFGALVFRCLGQKRAEAEAGMAVQLGAQ